MNPRFPHEKFFTHKNYHLSAPEVIEKLQDIISKPRQDKIREVVENRCCDISVVLDRIYDKGNICAVMRSCENLGFYNLNIIRSKKTKIANRVTKGAQKWLHIQKFNDYKDCLNQLKQDGHRIISTSLSSNCVDINEIDWSIPSAIVLGNEKQGVCKEIQEAADINCVIPTVGFGQSLNISVATAIILNHVMHDRIKRLGHHGDLSDAEKQILTAEYFKRAGQSTDEILAKN